MWARYLKGKLAQYLIMLVIGCINLALMMKVKMVVLMAVLFGIVILLANYSQGYFGPEGLIDVLAVNYQLYCTIGSDSQRVLLVKVMIGLYLFNLQLKVTIHKVLGCLSLFMWLMLVQIDNELWARYSYAI